MKILKTIYYGVNLASHLQRPGHVLSHLGSLRFSDTVACPSTSRWAGATVERHALAGALLMGGQTAASPLSNFAHCVALGLIKKDRLLGFASPAEAALLLPLYRRRYVVGNALAVLALLVGTGRRSEKMDYDFIKPMRHRNVYNQACSAMFADLYRYGLLGLPERALVRAAKRAEAAQARPLFVAAMVGAVACAGVMQALRVPLVVALMAIDGGMGALGGLIGAVVGSARVVGELAARRLGKRKTLTEPQAMAQVYGVLNDQVTVMNALFCGHSRQLRDLEQGVAQQQVLIASLKAQATGGMPGALRAHNERLRAATKFLQTLQLAPPADASKGDVDDARLDPDRLHASLAAAREALSCQAIGQIVATFVKTSYGALRTYDPRTVHEGFAEVERLCVTFIAPPGAPTADDDDRQSQTEQAVLTQQYLKALLAQRDEVLRLTRHLQGEWEAYGEFLQQDGINEATPRSEDRFPSDWRILREGASAVVGLAC